MQLNKKSFLNLNNIRRSCFLSAQILLLFFSATAFLVNQYYQFPGNNYFPPHSFLIASLLLLIYAGACLQYGVKSSLAHLLKEVIYFFFIMSLLALTTNAAQLTPFTPIDKAIIHFERLFNIHVAATVAWTHQHVFFKTILEIIYDSLAFQMSYIPLLVILTKRFSLLREYYFLLLISALIGFSFYYFFPTTAPASIVHSPYFSDAQRATGLKFHQIHAHIPPTTLAGGMVALPSFHTIWAWFCVYLLRDWPVAFYLLFGINVLLILSCVLLGWHYLLDIAAAIAIIGLSHWLLARCKQRIS